MVLQDRWSLMAVVSQGRFHCSTMYMYRQQPCKYVTFLIDDYSILFILTILYLKQSKLANSNMFFLKLLLLYTSALFYHPCTFVDCYIVVIICICLLYEHAVTIIVFNTNHLSQSMYHGSSYTYPSFYYDFHWNAKINNSLNMWNTLVNSYVYGIWY